MDTAVYDSQTESVIYFSDRRLCRFSLCDQRVDILDVALDGWFQLYDCSPHSFLVVKYSKVRNALQGLETEYAADFMVCSKGESAEVRSCFGATEQAGPIPNQSIWAGAPRWIPLGDSDVLELNVSAGVYRRHSLPWLNRCNYDTMFIGVTDIVELAGTSTAVVVLARANSVVHDFASGEYSVLPFRGCAIANSDGSQIWLQLQDGGGVVECEARTLSIRRRLQDECWMDCADMPESEQCMCLIDYDARAIYRVDTNRMSVTHRHICGRDPVDLVCVSDWEYIVSYIEGDEGSVEYGHDRSSTWIKRRWQ